MKSLSFNIFEVENYVDKKPCNLTRYLFFKRFMLVPIFLIFVIGRPVDSFSQWIETDFSLTINASSQTHALEPVFGLGTLTRAHEINSIDSLQLEGMRNNFWRLGTLSLDWWFPDTNMPPTSQDWAYFDAAATQYAKEVYELKVKYPDVVFGVNFDGMPKWLSSCAGNMGCFPQFSPCSPLWRQCPPNDTAAYTMLIRRIVTIFTQEGLADFFYGVWDEPEWMFYGNQAEYLEVYKLIANAVKQANPNAKVGGTNDANVYVRKWEYNKNDEIVDYTVIPHSQDTLMKKLIQYSAQDNLPLDFVDWHFPTTDPKGSGLERQVKDVRNWLYLSGHDTLTTIRIGEWTVSPCDEAARGELSAAYIVSMLKEMSRLGITYHNHTSWTDQSGWTDGCWVNVGLFSGQGQNPPSGVVRAKYNAFRMVSLLQDQRMEITEIDDYFVDAVATVDSSKDKLTVLLANYIANESAFRITQDVILKQGVLDTIEVKQLEDCVRYEFTVNGGNQMLAFYSCSTMFPPETQIQIVELFTDVQDEIIMRNTNLVNINLSFTGLADTLYELKLYAIDWNNANECRYNKRTEPVPSDAPCGVGGAIDQLAEQVETAANEALWHELLVNRNWTNADSALLVSVADNCSTSAIPHQCMLAWISENPYSFSKTDNVIITDIVAANQIKDSVYVAQEKTVASNLNSLPEVGLYPVSVAIIQPNDNGEISLPINLIPNGISLIKLKSLDGNASVEEIGETDSRNSVIVFPNPLSKAATFVINDRKFSGTGIYDLRIYDVLGENVFESKLAGSESTINLNLTAGIYIFHITNGLKFNETGRLVIQ